MNATGWVLVAAAGTLNDLWDLLVEFAERTEDEGPGVHWLPSSEKYRWCVHPNSDPAIEFRGDDLHELLALAAMWKAKQMDETFMWRRD
jgi:hypothetical protein